MKLSLISNIALTLVFFNVSLAESLTEDQAIEIGKAASKTLLSSLKKELQSSIASKGLAEAIDVCSEKAMPLTEAAASRNSLEGITVKRISFKFRNPANAPSEREKKILRFFEDASSSKGKLPPFLIKKESEHYMYYKPLTVSGMCLGCHGSKNTIPSDVRERLDRRYPNDMAFDYDLNDFRGVVKVEIPFEAVQED